ncbi:MAG: DNA-3-methyladenine glycosylase [bacterium]|nr:DNA-3-methyladenine glycosylase [bacterium]MXZ31097.1 DNA-3-methyladenine glycosylase [Acidimicrobiia bacterium]MDE0668893.1 DNA-3-methyladenine glycosylase [bacterium]MYB25441.1 DNA-3-methyladenine glycosylase [Acidimicrobiia bacterium]MYE66805.1 DNA-3-methyladenine glycosylase [Acidimicrobiia bacterium]
MTQRAGRGFFERPVAAVAPELLGMVLACGDRAGRIVEVEAYGGAEDPASHGHRGRTPRNEVMFGPPGRLYVYFSYGMHWCANVVCEPEGRCGAVLLRALAPLRGVEDMWADRPKARRTRDLCSGPAKLTAALGIDGHHNGADLLDPASPVAILEDGAGTSTHASSGRIGISAATERPWRWYVPGDLNVSRPPR